MVQRFKPSYIFIFLLQFLFNHLFAQQKNLDYYIESAIENSPLLKDFQNQQQSNTIDSLRIRASLKPQINGISNNTYAPNIKGWGYDYAVTNGGQLGALVSVSKTLLQKNNLANQFEAIQIQNQSLTNTGKITEQDLKKNITAQYISVFGDLQQYSFNKDVLNLLKKEEIILKQLTQSGVYKQTDYLTFLVTIQQQELLLTQLNIQYQNDFAALNYSAGLNDTSYNELPDPEISLNNLPGLENSVFYKQYVLDSLQLRNSDAQIDFAYQPKINLFADGGFLSAFSYQGYKNLGTSFGINLVIPIYDGKQKKMQHDKIAIAEDTRKNYRDFFSKQYSQQINLLLQQLNSEEKLISQTNAQINYSYGLIQANEKLLASGDVHIADYIIAINNYLNAKNIIMQSKITKYQIINQINYWNRPN